MPRTPGGIWATTPGAANSQRAWLIRHPIIKEDSMTTCTTLPPGWLAEVLAGLGTTGDEVAQTLRECEATGTPADIWDDPVASYIRKRAGDLAGPDALVVVMVTSDDIMVTTASTSLDPGACQELLAETPDAVDDFLTRFDAGEDYQDLHAPGHAAGLA
jgi:hypothetical protein